VRGTRSTSIVDSALAMKSRIASWRSTSAPAISEFEALCASSQMTFGGAPSVRLRIWKSSSSVTRVRSSDFAKTQSATSVLLAGR
jgi:hypothetical protein